MDAQSPEGTTIVYHDLDAMGSQIAFVDRYFAVAAVCLLVSALHGCDVNAKDIADHDSADEKCEAPVSVHHRLAATCGESEDVADTASALTVPLVVPSGSDSAATATFSGARGSPYSLTLLTDEFTIDVRWTLPAHSDAQVFLSDGTAQAGPCDQSTMYSNFVQFRCNRAALNTNVIFISVSAIDQSGVRVAVAAVRVTLVGLLDRKVPVEDLEVLEVSRCFLIDEVPGLVTSSGLDITALPDGSAQFLVPPGERIIVGTTVPLSTQVWPANNSTILWTTIGGRVHPLRALPRVAPPSVGEWLSVLGVEISAAELAEMSGPNGVEVRFFFDADVTQCVDAYDSEFLWWFPVTVFFVSG